MLKSKKIVAILALFSLVVTTSGLSYIGSAMAASLGSASDLLSTSEMLGVATHTISFVTNSTTSATEYFSVTLPGVFGVATATCPANYTASSSGTRTVRCTANTDRPLGTTTVLLVGVTNPSSAGSQTITIATYTSGGTVKQSADVQVAIIGGVAVSASVPSTLTFSVLGVATGTVIFTSTTTGATATNSIAFGSLQAGTSSVLAQQLAVTTNATNGYKVTVQQNQDLTNSGGATIDPFKDGAASTTAQAWAAPTAQLGQGNTYGHLAVTSNDTVISANQFATATPWKGFVGTAPMEVMYNAGPADGMTAGIGSSTVAFRIQISPLQEAGDYTNTLVYIATPTY